MSIFENNSRTVRQLAIAVSTIGFGQSAFVSLVPLIMDRLDLDTFDVGLATASGAAAFLIGAPFWGTVAGKFGQGRLLRLLAIVMLAGQAVFVALFAAGSIGSALALAVLIGSRAIYGFAASGVMPTAQAWASRSVAEERRRGALGLLSAGVSTGRLVGSIPAALAIISPLLPLVLFAASPALLWLAPRGRAPNAEAGKKRPGRIPPFDRRILPMLAIGFTLTLGFSLVQIVLGPMIAQKFDLDARAATSVTGLALTLVALVMITVQVLLVGRLRLNERASIVAGCVVAAAAMAALTLCESYTSAGAALVCAAFGIAIATPSYIAWLMRKVEPRQQGAAAGWLASTHVLGQSAGALGGGYAFTLSPSAPLIACCGLALLAALIAAITRDAGQ